MPISPGVDAHTVGGADQWMGLGILYEAILAFSDQPNLESFWSAVCERSRWIVPARRMAVLLHHGVATVQLAARLEGGAVLPPLAVEEQLSPQDMLTRALKSKKAQWHTEFPADIQHRSSTHQWLFHDAPSALLAVPIKTKHTSIGALVFAFDTVSDSDRTLLLSLATIYALHAGVTYTTLKTTSDLMELTVRLDRQHDDMLKIIEATPSLIIGLTPDGMTTFVNPSVEATLGATRQELVGRPWPSLFCAGHGHNSADRLFQARAWDDVCDYTVNVTTRDGEQRTIVWNFRSQVDPDGQVIGVISFGDDVTERQRIEEEQQRQRVQQEVIRAQDALLRELSTPLIPINDKIMVMPLAPWTNSVSSRC